MPAGVIEIAQSLRCSETLQKVVLGGVKVTQRMIKGLAAAAPRLKELSLSATAFPCSAADALTSMLAAMPTLRTVSVEMVLKAKQAATGEESFFQGHLPPAPIPRGSARTLTTWDAMRVLTPQDPTRCMSLRQQCLEVITYS